MARSRILHLLKVLQMLLLTKHGIISIIVRLTLEVNKIQSNGLHGKSSQFLAYLT